LLPLLSIQCMSRRDLSVKGGTSERCYRTRRGRTNEQRYAIISLYFDGRIKMNGPYPEITNISFLAKLFFKTFISLKHLSDYRTIGLSDYSYGPILKKLMQKKKKWSMGSKFFQNRKNSIWYSVFFTFPTIFHYISWACFFNPQRGIACFPSQNTLYSGNPRYVVDCRGNPSRKTRQHSMDWYTAHVYFVQSF
jgi:hypothetical protein